MTHEAPATLILSAAYCGQELRAEFGRLPPSFLPVGNKRLFERQIEALNGSAPLWLTLPDDFEISLSDQERIAAAGAEILRLDPSLSLAASLEQALLALEISGAVRILHGDTLVQGLDLSAPDTIAVESSSDHYDWAFCEMSEGRLRISEGPRDGVSRDVICGYFHLSDANLLSEALRETGRFTQALEHYGASRSLETVRCSEWLDFGHLATFFRSRRNLLTARSFNNLQSDGQEIIKFSDDTAKIRAEAAWYRALPTTLTMNTPRFLGDSDQNFKAGYRLEYLYLPTLADLFVFGRLPDNVWLRVLNCCADLLDTVAEHSPYSGSPESSPEFAARYHQDMTIEKSRERLEKFLGSRGWNLDTAFRLNGGEECRIGDVLETALSCLTPTGPADIRLVHGDFFFGNLFYDTRANRVIMVDPRGHINGGEACVYGDIRYDFAKLAHSVIGCYDHIIAGYSQLTRKGPTDWEFEISHTSGYAALVEAMFVCADQRVRLGRRELLDRVILLFLSMLPLHADCRDRQDHLLANALRLAKMAGDLEP